MNETSNPDPKVAAAGAQPADPAEAAAMESVDTTQRRGIQITDRAAAEVKRVIAEEGLPAESTWVRIGAKGGGCSGFSYLLDFDKNGPTEFDLTYEMHGVKLVVDKKSEFFMGGTIVDFNAGLLNRGFVFKNPAATGTCGCGTSFSV